MADDEEAVEHAERDRRDGEEVHRRDSFSMIAQKGEPMFGWLGISWCSPHPTRNRSFGDIDTEHQKLTVNAWRATGSVLPHHPKDEIPNFLRNPFSADYPAGFGDGTPIERESRSVPSHNGLRAHNDQSLFPSGPEPSRQDPEESVEG